MNSSHEKEKWRRVESRNKEKIPSKWMPATPPNLVVEPAPFFPKGDMNGWGSVKQPVVVVAVLLLLLPFIPRPLSARFAAGTAAKRTGGASGRARKGLQTMKWGIISNGAGGSEKEMRKFWFLALRASVMACAGKTCFSFSLQRCQETQEGRVTNMFEASIARLTEAIIFPSALSRLTSQNFCRGGDGGHGGDGGGIRWRPEASVLVLAAGAEDDFAVPNRRINGGSSNERRTVANIPTFAHRPSSVAPL